MALLQLILIIVAVVAFVLELIGVVAPKIKLTTLGLACLAGFFLVGRFI